MKHTTNFPVAAKASLALPPRIAINGRFLTQRTSGVQRFASETIKAIDALLETELFVRSRAASKSLRRRKRAIFR